MTRLTHAQLKYSASERQAERDIDTFLKTVNGAHSLDILAELKKATS